MRSIRDGRIILRKQFGATCLHNPTNRQLQYIVKSSTSDDWADMDIDSLIDPDSPDFDDIKLDDAFYEVCRSVPLYWVLVGCKCHKVHQI